MNTSDCSDSDAVYQKAVRKLRLLLSASEILSMDENDLSSDEEQQTVKDNPNVSMDQPRFLKNKKGASGVRRGLAFGNKNLGKGDRHNSWHNLTYLDQDKADEKTRLVQRQEEYIKQLEKETHFCREQLHFVLQNVKDVLRDKERTVERSKEVEDAISSVFKTIQKWQNNVDPTDAGDFPSEYRSVMVKKLKSNNEVLTKALQETKTEMDEIKRREEEAAEEVKRSLQVVEQLKMEKTEMEYEHNQLKLQIDRQQNRIRNLIEEQISKVEEENAIVEKRYQAQLQATRSEIHKHLEEIGQLSAKVDHLQRCESEASRKCADKEKIIDELQHDMEKRLGQVNLENVRLKSVKQDLESENNSLRLDMDHTKREMQAETMRRNAEIASLQSRLSKMEQLLTQSRDECLSLAEEKTSLEKHISLLKSRLEVAEKAHTSTGLQLSEEAKQRSSMQVAKLEDLIRRQSQLIGELRQQCSLATDRLEETVGFYEQERADFILRIKTLETEHVSVDKQLATSKNHLQDRGRLQEKLLSQLDRAQQELSSAKVDLRQSRLRSETLKQENSDLNVEIEFYRDILKSKDLLPEKDTRRSHSGSSGLRNSSRDDTLSGRHLNEAIIVSRNGEVFSPPLKMS